MSSYYHTFMYLKEIGSTTSGNPLKKRPGTDSGHGTGSGMATRSKGIYYYCTNTMV